MGHPVNGCGLSGSFMFFLCAVVPSATMIEVSALELLD
jgi:hypothetical protein